MAKILAAVSDNSLRSQISETLENAGHFVILAPNGGMTHDIMIHNPSIDVLIIDADLSDIPPGRILARILRTEQQFCDMPFIMLLSPSLFDEVEELIELGPSYFVAKPVDTTKLLATLSTVLEKHA